MSSDITHASTLLSELERAAGEAADTAIRVQNLSKCYQIYDKPRDRLLQMLTRGRKQFFREFWALRDVSFEIKKGETVGIIGRNGSGKSTLLQMICGTLNPTGGGIQTNGRIAALLELGSGFNPEFTGRENVYMNGAVLGLSREEVDERFDDIAAFADIGQFIEQPVKTYSSGMFVRLAFAVNIMSKPEIMVVDEALSVGDMAFQAKCMTALTRIQDSGATVLFVSHDISALKSLCTRGIYLEHGVVQAIGPAGDVAEHYVRKMREEMNAEFAGTGSLETSRDASGPRTREQTAEARAFKKSVDFDNCVSHFRYGDGGARITFAELLDEDFRPINEVSFNQSVFVRVYFETSIDGEVGCNYYVLDDKRNFILGAALNLVGEEPLMRVKDGGRYVVTYKTRLPLYEGSHSIQLQIVKATGRDDAAIFLDVIDDAIVFKMARREGARIWAKAFVENEVEIKAL